jgi:hypothetical protein
MSGNKPGLPAKGSDILEKFAMNRVPPKKRKVFKHLVRKKKEVSQKKLDAMAKAREAKQEQYLMTEAEKAAAEEEKRELTGETEAAPEVIPEDSEVEDEVLTKKEKKLKDDLTWVMEKLGGRKKILEMAKKSDALKVVIIKELLKVETKELEARLRSKDKGGEAGAGFFMVIAGLGDTERVKKSGMDMKRFGNALTPSEPVPIDLENEEEVDLNHE